MALWTPANAAAANRGRWFWTGDLATLTLSGSFITAWADKFGNASLTESAAGNPPGLATSGGFGSKGVARSSNGAPFPFGRVSGSVSDLAGETDILVVVVASVLTSAEAWCRIISVGTGSGTDYNAFGKFNVCRYSTNDAVQVQSNSVLLPSTGDAFTSNAPFVATARFNGTNAYWSFNGGSEVSAACSFSLVSSGILKFFVDQDGLELFYGDIRSVQIYKGSAAATSTLRDQAVGWGAWDATDDGSLLPVGHAYKSAAPTVASSLILPPSRPLHHLLIR